MSLVRAKATGGSAPLEAIQLDESQAESWRKRFAKEVIADAKSRGLLRGRWTRVDWIVFGVLIAAVLAAIAGGLFLARVEDKGEGEQRGLRPRDLVHRRVLRVGADHGPAPQAAVDPLLARR